MKGCSMSKETMTNIRDIICPDGKRRTFWTNGTAANGRPRGYVQVNGVSVSGYAKSVGRGYHFLPNPNSKNLHLIRPATLVVGTRVELDNGYYGTIVGVEWNYLKAELLFSPIKSRQEVIMSEPTPDYERGRILSMITGVYILKVSKHRDAVVEVSHWVGSLKLARLKFVEGSESLKGHKAFDSWAKAKRSKEKTFEDILKHATNRELIEEIRARGLDLGREEGYNNECHS